MTYEFNDNEVSALKTLIDIAIRAQGIKVAETGIVLLKKLDTPKNEISKEHTKK